MSEENQAWVADKRTGDELFRRGDEIERLQLELDRARRSHHMELWLSWWIAAAGITAVLAGPWSWQAAAASILLPYPLYVWIGKRLD